MICPGVSLYIILGLALNTSGLVPPQLWAKRVDTSIETISGWFTRTRVCD